MTEVKPLWIAVRQVVGAVAVVEMHAHRNVRIDLHQRVDHVRQHDVVGVLAGAAAGLDDRRRVDRVGGRHRRQTLLHIVDVEGRNAVAALGGVVQKLPESYACHADLRATGAGAERGIA